MDGGGIQTLHDQGIKGSMCVTISYVTIDVGMKAVDSTFSRLHVCGGNLHKNCECVGNLQMRFTCAYL